MMQPAQDQQQAGWLDAAGVPHILRTLGFAIDPVKLGLALIGILLTLLLGTILDAIWISAGVQTAAAPDMAMMMGADFAGEEAGQTNVGVFEYVRDQEMAAINGSVAGAMGMPVPIPGMGMAWMVNNHTLYFIIFVVGFLLIWSVLGGAITRMVALQCTRDEKPTASDAIDYARQNLIGGYFLSPCIPLGFMGVIAVCMIVGGLFLRLPVVGDIICGLAFPLAILGGIIMTGLYIGLLVGGSLLFPAVSTDGSDAFDAFSRSMSYVFTKPWKTILYALLAIVFGSLCWWFVQFFVGNSLDFTQKIVSWGTAPFGLWERAEGVSKLDMIWPAATLDGRFQWADWSQLSWYESISAALVGVFVLLTIIMAWSFLFSYYFCASTAIYILLRRDVDGTDVSDIFVEEPGDSIEELPTEYKSDNAAPAALAGDADDEADSTTSDTTSGDDADDTDAKADSTTSDTTSADDTDDEAEDSAAGDDAHNAETEDKKDNS